MKKIEIDFKVSKEELDAQREKLRVEMCKYQDIASKYRLALDSIDQYKNQERRERIKNLCFKHKEASLDSNFTTYARIENFDEQFRPIGTSINLYNGEVCSINFLGHIWDEDIDNGSEISEEHFNEILEKVKRKFE